MIKKNEGFKIFVINRTKKKPEELKDLFEDLHVLDWGSLIDFDIIINATSLGLKENVNLN